MNPLPSSYRDDAGFVFEQDGRVFRYIHPRYYKDYALLMESGLYSELAKKGLLVPHQEISAIKGFGLPEGKVILDRGTGKNQTRRDCRQGSSAPQEDHGQGRDHERDPGPPILREAQ